MSGEQHPTVRQLANRNKRTRTSGQNVGSSSSQQPPRVQPQAGRIPEEVNAKYQPKISVEKLRNKRIIAHRTLDWGLMQRMGIEDRVKQSMSDDWKRFFAIRTPAFKSLCVEFFGTLRVDISDNRNHETTMTFRLCGQVHALSYAEFGVHMGLYTQEEVNGDSFRHRLAGWPAGMNATKYWSEKQIGVEAYRNGMTQTDVKGRLNRYMLRAIAESINNRGESPHKVTTQDLFCFYCIMEQVPCNLAKYLAVYLFDRGHGNEKGAISGGSFVTRLAIGMGLANEAALTRAEKPAALVTPINLVAVKNMGILPRHWREEDDVVDDEEEAEAENEAGNENEDEAEQHHEQPHEQLEDPFSMQAIARQLGNIQGRLDSFQNQYSEDWGQFQHMYTGDQHMIHSQLERVQYTQDRYQPYWDRWAQHEAQTYNLPPPPPYQAPDIFIPPHRQGGFFYPPRQQQQTCTHDAEARGSGIGGFESIFDPPVFGTHKSSAPSIFNHPDDMQQ